MDGGYFVAQIGSSQEKTHIYIVLEAHRCHMSYQAHGVIVTIKASFAKCFCRGDTGMSSVSPA